MSRVIIIYSVIIFAGVILFFVGSRYAFQKACKRRASHPANLETADDEQNSLSTKNEKIIITTSVNRPPEVRPKNLTIGGRFSYGKI